jgi:hypothetical protein
LICPECGFEQPEAAECARCGARVDLYRQPPQPEPPPAQPPAPAYGGRFAGVGAIYGIPPGEGAAEALPAAPTAPAHHLETGPTLHDSFAVFFANFLPFVAISLVALLPRLAVAAFFPTLQPTPRTPAEVGHSCLTLLLILGTQILGSQLAAGAITDGVLRHLRGAEVAVGESLVVGLRAMGRVLGVALLAGLGIVLGCCACIVPGIVLAVQWAVAVPVALEEDPGVSASLSRSSALTAGSRWPIFAVLVILQILDFGLLRLVAIAMGSLTSWRPDLVTTLVSIPLTGLSGTASAVIYYRLRSLKESIDVRHLASVFD